jgi:hypothetical protein
MSKACPIPTSEQRRYGEIQAKIEQEMLRKVHAALRAATEQAQAELQASNLGLPPPSERYFASVIHQRLFCSLCEADPETFVGGNARIATVIITNMQNIARYHWGAASSGQTSQRPTTI